MSAALEARWIGVAEREAALTLLSRDPRANLYLLDLTDRIGAPVAPGDVRPEVVGAWRGEALVAVAALRPSVVFDADAGSEAVEVLLPCLEALGTGLVKSESVAVDALWGHLSRRGKRRALLDRTETCYAVRADELKTPPRPPGLVARPARPADLEPLVFAARESLREEGRPDPFSGDARGFRRWVRGRVARARVVSARGRIVFAGYADVQRPEGWLIQGVYTWPPMRRRGIARVGVFELCREAFAAGARHVQLAVVDGNEAGRRLYEALGFTPFARLRTILFC